MSLSRAVPRRRGLRLGRRPAAGKAATTHRLRGRQKALAINAVLGATRLRILRVMLGEGLIAAAGGTALGLACAAGMLHVVRTLGPASLPQLEHATLDATGVALAVLAALCATVGPTVFALARRDTSELQSALGSRSSHYLFRTNVPVRHLQRGLCALQVAVACSLSIVAALLLVSLHKIKSVPLGLNPERLYTIQFVPSGSTARDFAVTREFATRVREVPGVTEVALSDNTLLMESGIRRAVRVQRMRGGWPHTPLVLTRAVEGDFFRVLQVPLLRGRVITDLAREGSPCVTVVNQTAADAFWPGVSPLGVHVDLNTSGETPELCTVVGVVVDSRTLDVRRPPEPELFFSARQWGTGSLFVFVRVDSVEGPAIPAMRQLASEASPLPDGVTLWAVQDVLRQTWQEPRFRSVSVTLLAGCILVLSCFGIYGVTAQATKQRQREFAIRGALGATGRDIGTIVLREAATTTGAGVLAGSLLALSGSHVLDSVLYGVSAVEWPVWTVVLLLVGAASIAASLVPALRATALETRALYSDSD